MRRARFLVLLGLLFASGGAQAAGVKVSLLDGAGLSQCTATVSLVVGSVGMKTALAPLPATVDTGARQFTATIYKAYLTSTTDPAVEIPLGSVYPTSAGKAALKVALKGDVSHLGL